MEYDASAIMGTWNNRKGGYLKLKQDGTFEATIFPDSTPGKYQIVGGKGIVTSTGYVLNIISMKSNTMVVNGGDGEFVLTRSNYQGIIPIVVLIFVVAFVAGAIGGTAEVVIGLLILPLFGLLIYKIVKKVKGYFR